jgi:hypothetical protein
MSKYTPQNYSLIFFSLISLLFFNSVAQANFEPYREAVIQKIVDEDKMIAKSDRGDWPIGEILVVVSQNPKLGSIAFVDVIATTERPDGTYELKLGLLRQSRKYFIQVGDYVRRLDLSSDSDDYIGATELLIKNSTLNISSKYRPLVYQGFVIGDTAQTLYEKEFLINYFGNLYYGFNDWLTLGTLAPVNVLGRPNANFRAKVFDSESTTLAVGMSFVRLNKENEASLNLNFYWDNTSSEALISHTFVGLGLINWSGSAEAAAIKYLTASSFQTGYEIILDNWNRFLIGPSYNFEKKALGGYLSYVWILDRFHFQASINATDITHLRLDPTDGYYGFLDMYWRF